jgi:acyl-CoA reductase-like NAD-dependent aldehyde dehydrogenase
MVGTDGPLAAEHFTSVNPAHPTRLIGRYPLSPPSAVDEAVAVATEAQRAWLKVPVPLRAERIGAVGDVLAARKGELTRLVAEEAGKVLVEAGGDVQEAVDMARYVAGLGRLPWGETVPSELGSRLAFTTRQPVGVVGLITPWNFPVAIPSWKCFPALLAGNAVVLKPSELAPACAEAFVDACIEGGIPADLLNVVHGRGEVGARIAVHPGIRAVSFTGSVATGRRVAAAAAEVGPKLVSLELGGKNAMVVLDDADLDLALEGALFGAFGTAGQRCTSTSRLVVHRAVADELVERLAERASQLVVGDPCEAGTDVGPVIDAAAITRLEKAVATAGEEGATVVVGGGPVQPGACPDGTFFAPTILRGVEAHHHAATTELFGPVLSVIEVDSAEEAVAVVNGVEYGLSAAVYSRDLATALSLVDAIDTGIVYVNAPSIGAEIQLPFGGTKHTGNGFREAGRRGIEQFSEVKSVYVDYSGRLQRAQIDVQRGE